MEQDKEITPVVFRVERSGQFKGSVTAVFPILPADRFGMKMTCYAHVGQHHTCSLAWYYTTRLAKTEEYVDLMRELESIGYRLKVYQKITSKMRDELKRNAGSGTV